LGHGCPARLQIGRLKYRHPQPPVQRALGDTGGLSGFFLIPLRQQRAIAASCLRPNFEPWPVLEEPLVLRIILVSPDGQQVDSGMEFKVPAVQKPFKKGRR
jgi:hypothetical protein